MIIHINFLDLGCPTKKKKEKTSFTKKIKGAGTEVPFDCVLFVTADCAEAPHFCPNRYVWTLVQCTCKQHRDQALYFRSTFLHEADKLISKHVPMYNI